MPKVLFLASIEATLRLFVAPLARNLGSIGIESIAVAGGLEGNVSGFTRAYGLPAFRRGSPAAITRAYHRLCQILAEVRPSVVHLHTPPALVIGRLAARSQNVPSIAVAHGSFLEPRGPRSVLYAAFETLLGPLSTATATENEEDARFYRRFVRSTNVTVAPVGGIGIDLKRLRAARENPVSTGHSPSIVVVGRLTPEKNLDAIVNAFRKIKMREPNAGLQFVGSSLSGDRPWRVPDIDGVTHVPWVDDPYPLIAGADVMALASRREGFSMTAAESILLGTPVVAVSNRGIRQLLRWGAHGLITTANDSDAIADGIERAIRSESRPAFDTGLAVHWSQESAIRFHRELILRVLSGASNGSGTVGVAARR